VAFTLNLSPSVHSRAPSRVTTDEEVLFRGLLQPLLERVLGAGLGLPASALLFGLAHVGTPFLPFLTLMVSRRQLTANLRSGVPAGGFFFVDE
jgi:membrane protease YdiL (CAAX protease family)